MGEAFSLICVLMRIYFDASKREIFLFIHHLVFLSFCKLPIAFTVDSLLLKAP